MDTNQIYADEETQQHHDKHYRDVFSLHSERAKKDIRFARKLKLRAEKTRPLLTESMDPTEKDSFLMEGGWDTARLPAGTVLKLHEWGYTLVDKSLPPFHRIHPGSEQRPLLFKLNTITINYQDGSKTI